MGTLGIIGGAGPLATAHFHTSLMKGAAQKGAHQDHHFPRVLLDSRPIEIDAEGNYSAGASGLISDRAKALTGMGASTLVLVCNTLHLALPQELPAQLVSLPGLTVEQLRLENFRKVGILSSRVSKREGLYSSALKAVNIEPVETTEAEQVQLDGIIGRIMGGRWPVEEAEKLLQALYARGAETVVLGCTELSMLGGEITSRTHDPVEIVVQHLLGEE